MNPTTTAQWESVMQAEDESSPLRVATKHVTRSRRDKGRATPRRALTVDEAARSLGISRDHFERHVMPDLRIVRSGRRRLIPVSELDRWLDQHATTAA
jgi:excisionase family DNA binding protein